MTTFVIRDGKLVEKQRRYQGDGIFAVMGDIEPFVTVDGIEISSRSALRSHERAHGVRQIGNDWAGSEKPAYWDALTHRAGRRRR